MSVPNRGQKGKEEGVWLFCCDPCRTRGRTVRGLVRWLKARKIPYSVWDEHHPPPSDQQPRLLLLSGSRYTWSDNTVPAQLAEVLRQLVHRMVETSTPMLGICFGMQSIMHLLGGKVGPSAEGFVDRVEALDLEGRPVEVYRYHGDVVRRVAPGFKIIARSNGFQEVMAVRALHRPIWGYQFHPEMLPHTWDILDKAWNDSKGA